MDEFLQVNITGNLLEVPGIGPAAVKALAKSDNEDDRITNTYQLIGRYLMLKGPDRSATDKVESMEHNNKFWYYLKSRGIAAHRSGIVQCIARKCGTFMAGIYDPTVYEDDSEDDDNDEGDE
jgi:hypothetical protein